jgi:hypothetical protein
MAVKAANGPKKSLSQWLRLTICNKNQAQNGDIDLIEPRLTSTLP